MGLTIRSRFVLVRVGPTRLYATLRLCGRQQAAEWQILV